MQVCDSEGTMIGWERQEQAGAHYRVKESITTTKLGATVTVLVSNMVARAMVRSVQLLTEAGIGVHRGDRKWPRN
jgi:hypothetical protein